MSEKFLITGASGCIGSWALRVLIDRGIEFVASDLTQNTERTKLLMSDEELTNITWVELDVTDTQAVKSVVREQKITRIVHLARPRNTRKARLWMMRQGCPTHSMVFTRQRMKK